MAGAMGTALQWALVLLRTPGERHALRAAPLPEGVRSVLGIAAGVMPDALGRAVTAFDESESRIVEACRFYVREVLFHPSADAYRLLGVDRGASGQEIKRHHRILQHWLHPDRLKGEDDVVFAGRVNWAWNQLRSEARRERYDSMLSEMARPANPAASSSTGIPALIAGPDETLAKWMPKLPVLLLTVVCVVLAVLVVRQGDRPQIRVDGPSEDTLLSLIHI